MPPGNLCVMKNATTTLKTTELFLSELAPVARALETWRKARKFRQPIPEHLWGQMAGLARRHGVSRVSQALRLDYYSLQRRVEAPAGGPDFVEIKMASAVDQSAGCAALLEDGTGRKLLLRWSGSPGPEFLGVVQSFLSQGA